MATAAQITANQLNAQKSTGPATTAGKLASSNNALRHGLTSKQLLVPGEDPVAFQALHDRLKESYGPEGEAEEAYVAELAEHEWRRTRARRVETATLNLYLHRYLAEAEGNHDLALALAFDRHGKELDRLRRYEYAITRAFDRILDKLAKLIKVRHLLEAQAARDIEESEAEDGEGLAFYGESGFVSHTTEDHPWPPTANAASFTGSGFDEQLSCNL